MYVSKQIDKLTKPVIFNPKLNNNGDIHIVYLPIVNGAIKDFDKLDGAQVIQMFNLLLNSQDIFERNLQIIKNTEETQKKNV